MKSIVITYYKRWLESAAPEAIEFVDSVYEFCEKHYEAGGDTICECLDPSDIMEEFKTLDDVKEYMGIKVEQALDCRWGEDDDPELYRYEKFKEIE